jgi:hypothetical protein
MAAKKTSHMAAMKKAAAHHEKAAHHHEEAHKWIQSAIKHPGALHKELGVPEGKKIPAKKLAAAAKKPGVEGKRARLAETLKGFKK